MSISINNRSDSLRSANQLDKNTNQFNKHSKALADGLKSNLNAADLEVATKSLADAVLYEGVGRGAADVGSALAMADSGYEQISEGEIRKAELAMQAGNSLNGAQQRKALDAEYQAITQEQQRIAATTKFNGNSLLQSDQAMSFQTGPNSDENLTLTAADSPDISSGSLAAGGDPGAALDATKVSLAGNTSSRATVGANMARVSSVQNVASVMAEENTAAGSAMIDADVPEEKSGLDSSRLRQQTGIAAYQARQDANKTIIQSILA